MTNYGKNEIRMCQDCGHDTYLMRELYMLHHDLWDMMLLETGSAHMLCIGCVENRLGRRLVPRDFLSCPLNESPKYKPRSLRLRQRMGMIEEQRWSTDGDRDDEI